MRGGSWAGWVLFTIICFPGVFIVGFDFFFLCSKLVFSFCQFLFLLEMIDDRLDSVIPMPDLLLFFILLETFL